MRQKWWRIIGNGRQNGKQGLERPFAKYVAKSLIDSLSMLAHGTVKSWLSLIGVSIVVYLAAAIVVVVCVVSFVTEELCEVLQ